MQCTLDTVRTLGPECLRTQDSITNYKNILRKTAQRLEMNYKLVKNTPNALKACTNPVRIKGDS